MAQTFDTPLYSSDQSIERVLKSGLPVVLVFRDSTIPPALDLAMKNLAKQSAGQLLVVQMDRSDSAQTANRFDIHSAPAVVTIKNGQEFSKAEGIDSTELERHAAYLLGKGPRPEPKVQQRATTGAYAGAGAGSSYSAYSQPGPTPTGNNQNTHPLAVTDATFDQEVMRSPVPVVVDFWAPWCGPCRMVAPTLDKLASEWSGKVKIAKVNVDENPGVAGRYGVSGIPTMMVVRSGRIVEQWAGALPEPALRARLSNALR